MTLCLRMKKPILATLSILAAALITTSARAQIFITEWMYSGASHEFIEFTNMSSTFVDMTGWGYSDSLRLDGDPPTIDLSEFGALAPGESVILTDVAAEDFRVLWGLDDSVKVIGGLTRNLGRSDEINLYDSFNTLIDSLTYNDQGSGDVKGPRTQNASGWTAVENLGLNQASLWQLSSLGDALQSWESIDGDTGNPGTYFPAVPEPAPWALVGLGFVCTLWHLRRRSVA